MLFPPFIFIFISLHIFPPPNFHFLIFNLSFFFTIIIFLFVSLVRKGYRITRKVFSFITKPFSFFFIFIFSISSDQPSRTVATPQTKTSHIGGRSGIGLHQHILIVLSKIYQILSTQKFPFRCKTHVFNIESIEHIYS